jgi:glycosyltransferase involved in cell wall biosynthesis
LKGDRWGSNPRQPEPQSGALPAELRPPFLEVQRNKDFFFIPIAFFFRVKIFFIVAWQHALTHILNPKKLNILFLSSWYPGKTHATLGNFVQRHAEAISSLHNVTVLYVSKLNLEAGNYQVEEQVVNGLRTIYVYYRPGIFSIWRKLTAFRKGLAYMKEQSILPFDLIHHNVIWSNGWQALWAKREMKIPIVITEHWTGYDTRSRPHQGKKVAILSKWVAKQSSVICPVSDDLGSTMKKFGLKGNYTTVPNVVNTNLFVVGQKDPAVTRFLHVSSLFDDQKNVSGILKAWKLASDEKEDIHLMIGGDGPWEKLQQLSIQLGIRPASITFFGEKKSSEIAELMGSHNCLVMFSRYENLPCTIVEAMACGMAVITTAVGGITEHINEKRGIIIPEEDVHQLAAALLNFRSNAGQFHSESLRLYAVTKFSDDNVASAYGEVYQSVLKKEKTNIGQ